MEDANNKEDLQGSVLRQAFMRPSGALKPTSSGRSTPRSSPSYRRMRTPRRDLRSGSWKQGLFGRNRLFLWLILIIGWAYVVFYFQCKLWPDKHDAEFVTDQENAARTASDVRRLKEGANGSPVLLENNTVGNGSKVIGVTLIRKENHASHRENTTRRKKVKRPPAISSGRLENDTKSSTQPNATTSTHGINHGANFGVSWRNTSYGLLIGPFGKIEDSVLGWPAQKIRGACNRKTLFAHFVKSKRFVLIIHELSMTGAPLSMMELATELLGCGGTVSVIVLSRKGGLLAELDRRGIHVLDDRGELSIRTARKADLIVAGSAVCSSWIDQYLLDITPRSSQILWWIMENRREYFDRSKHVLGKVQTLMFLSESQSQQWLSWCAEEGIKLMKRPLIVPLSVNDELACIAGIECIFNNSLLNVEKMRESRNALRLAVRKEMGLSDNDMLVMSLSSINPGKGQRLFVESLATMYEGNHLSTDGVSSGIVQDAGDSELKDNLLLNSIDVAVQPKRRRRKRSRRARSSGNSGKLEANRNTQTSRNLLSKVQLAKGKMELKVLIGSVGSKSNKPLYLKGILKFLSQHPKLVKSLIWTPATTHVASLYAAADAYVINAQGVGETFGRVTIEAMAFGLPVLGTDAGGTKEIVEDKVTGLLHPVSRQGMHPLVQNLNFLLSNASARELLGTNGRLKVERMYLKHHMYEKLAHGIAECIKMK